MNGLCHQIGEGTGRGEKRFARDLDRDLDRHAHGLGDGIRLGPEPTASEPPDAGRLKRCSPWPAIRRITLRRGCRCRCHDSQRRGIEMIGPGVEFHGWPAGREGGPLQSGVIARPVRIGGMTLNACHGHMCGQRSARPIFIASPNCRGRSVRRRGRRTLPRPRSPSSREARPCAVGRITLFVAGDGEHDGAIGRRGPDKVDGRRRKSGHARFHVGCAPAIEPAIPDFSAEGVRRSARRVRPRDHVGMAIEAEGAVRALAAPAAKGWRCRCGPRACRQSPPPRGGVREGRARPLPAGSPTGSDKCGGQFDDGIDGHPWLNPRRGSSGQR